MTDEAIQAFKSRLESMRTEIKGDGFHEFKPNRTDDIGRRDEDHQPLNEMSQSIASSRNRTLKKSLGKIERALKRIKDDPEDFGLCIECEEPIPAKRLEIMPFAELCVRCLSELEGDGPNGTRRSLTDYI